MPQHPASGTTARPSVLLALPELLLTSSLADALRPRCHIAGVAHSWDALERGLEGLSAGVLVTDLMLGGVLILPHLTQLVAAHPRTRIVVCTPDPDPRVAVRLLLDGVVAVVGRDVPAAELGTAICELCHRGVWPVGLGTSSVATTPGRAPLEPLSVRQQQVAELLWRGQSHADIAVTLGVSVKSVERYTAELRKAYGVRARLPGPWEQGLRGRPPGE